MMKNPYLFAFLICCTCGFSQVGINTTKPNAQLDIKSSNPASPSNTDGILIPNIDVFPSTKPGAEQNGMMVYLTKTTATNASGFYFWDNNASQWKSIGAAPNSLPNPNTAVTGPTWLTAGNAGVTATDFLGTTDNADLIFKRNNGAAGRIGIQNTAFGAGAFSSATGSVNTAFGVNALSGSGSSAIDNVGIGQNALAANNNVANVAVGNYVLQNNTSGSMNTAVGSSSMYFSTAGSGNTTLGFATMYASINGINNTAIGNIALRNSTTGYSNTALGTGSLYKTTEGFQNTALGQYAFRENQLGRGNVGVGYSAGYNELGSNRLYIENSNAAEPLIYGEFDNDLLRFNGKVKIHTVGVANNEMLIKNSNKFVHSVDANLNFGVGGNDFIMASNEGMGETGGIRGDGDNITIWSPGDGGKLVRFVDEDNWGDNNGNPYDNAAEKSYIDPNGQYFQVSDKHKKDNIGKIENPIAKLEKLNGYTYQFKLSPEEIAKGQKAIACSGVLAQELETAFPEAVQKNENGDYFVDYAAITPLLIEVAKAQQHKISVLEARLKSIEEKLK